MTTFSGSVSLWSILGDSGPIEVLLWCYRGSYKAWEVRKLVKIDRNYDFCAVFVHFHIPKVGNDYIYWYYKFMKTIGIFWAHTCILLWYYKGSERARGVSKWVKINLYYDFCAVFVHFLLTNGRNEYIFWLYKFMETIGRFWALTCTSLIS